MNSEKTDDNRDGLTRKMKLVWMLVAGIATVAYILSLVFGKGKLALSPITEIEEPGEMTDDE